MLQPQLVCKNVKISDIDFTNKTGILEIEQKVYFANKSKLHPNNLNNILARRIMQDGNIINELKELISKILMEMFGVGMYGVFSKKPEVNINFVRYSSDMKNSITLHVYFSFDD